MTEHLLAINQKLKNPDEAISLFGKQDSILKYMEKDLNVNIITR
ncbi:phosphate starvation-inducible protein PhoH, partial [Bacillus subtilis]|nr:phosphate starvation-inducible protein PhoH [Bacillus subtilis]